MAKNYETMSIDDVLGMSPPKYRNINRKLYYYTMDMINPQAMPQKIQTPIMK